MPEELIGTGDAGGCGPTMEVLGALWREVLGIDRAVAGEESFFELGGHSLLAVELTFGIFDAFGVEVSLHELLEEPTMGGMARLVDERVSGAPTAAFGESAGAFAELSAEQMQGLFDDA